MSTVYLAEQQGVGRKVAVKVMTDQQANDTEAMLRFENEARTIGQLDHPNIVRIFDVGRSNNGQPYFSMPWLPHGDLAQRHDRRQPRRIIEVMRALLRALSYAHARGVVHRDVKPENVMFGADNQPRLTDFGIALSTDAEMRVTRPGATVGSSGYMSPEQARGLPTDGRSDLYSVGVMLYELLTGELPYPGPDALSVAIAHIEDPIPPMPATQRIWQPVIDRALAKQPGERFVSADEMLEALEDIAPRVLAGATDSMGWRGAWQSWQTRNRGVLVGISALLLTAVLLTVLVLVRSREVPQIRVAPAISVVAPTLPPHPMLSAEELDRLIREGNIRLSLGSLVEPAGNSAADRFSRILQTYPTNPEALTGLQGLYEQMGQRIDKALNGEKVAEALHMYQQAQQLADQAGIRQQAFWLPFVSTVKRSTTRSLQRASRQAQVKLDALAPLARALDLAVPALQMRKETKPAPIDKPVMVHVGDGLRDEGGPPLVVVSAAAGQGWAIAREPVSRAQYARFASISGRKPSSCRTPGNIFSRMRGLSWQDPGFKQGDGGTAVCISWRDARAYLGWLSQTTGQNYRLPSASEQQAARKLSDTRIDFGNGPSEWLLCTGSCDQVQYMDGRSGKRGEGDSDMGYSTVGFRALRDIPEATTP